MRDALAVLLTVSALFACGEAKDSSESNGALLRSDRAIPEIEPIVIIPPAPHEYSRSDTIDIEAVENAIQRSAGYLVRQVKENGMFEYRVNMDPSIRVARRYNILRHAGTMYAMSMYYQMDPDESVRAALERAGGYLRDEAIAPVPDENDMLAVWSKPDVNGSGRPLQAKLGGTGLGLVALLSLEKIRPGFTPLADLRKLGRFVIYMQSEDGSFYSLYIPSMGGRQGDWQSLYYPGEAALGLLMLYERDPSDAWLEAAANALAYLARSREGETDIPSDHWALLATAKMLELVGPDQLPAQEELLVDHAIQICEAILRDQISGHERLDYNGGFFPDGRTTPTATRLEGLLAAATLLPPEHELRTRIDSSARRGLDFLLRAQIQEGEYSGAMPRAIGKLSERFTNAEDFNRRATEVRIDYVQHAMSAMIQYSHSVR